MAIMAKPAKYTKSARLQKAAEYGLGTGKKLTIGKMDEAALARYNKTLRP